MHHEKDTCPICGGGLEETGGLSICPRCNDAKGDYYNCLSRPISDFADQSDKVLIECPGATLYYPGTDEVAAGARFFDNDDPSKGYEIVGRPVYGPKHVRHRWVKKEDAHLIRRCQSCQDYTIRMRRKEGPDLYIPSVRNPQLPRHRHRPQDFNQRGRPGLGL
jgi:hypothetical protein